MYLPQPIQDQTGQDHDTQLQQNKTKVIYMKPTTCSLRKQTFFYKTSNLQQIFHGQLQILKKMRCQILIDAATGTCKEVSLKSC